MLDPMPKSDCLLTTPKRTLALLFGWLRQSLSEPAVNYHGNTKWHVQRGKNLERVRFDGKASCAIIRPVTTEHIHHGIKLREIMNVRLYRLPEASKVLRQLGHFRNGCGVMPSIIFVWTSFRTTSFPRPVHVAWYDAQRVRDFVEWQISTVDT